MDNNNQIGDEQPQKVRVNPKSFAAKFQSKREGK